MPSGLCQPEPVTELNWLALPTGADQSLLACLLTRMRETIENQPTLIQCAIEVEGRHSARTHPPIKLLKNIQGGTTINKDGNKSRASIVIG